MLLPVSGGTAHEAEGLVMNRLALHTVELKITDPNENLIELNAAAQGFKGYIAAAGKKTKELIGLPIPVLPQQYDHGYFL